MSVASSLVLAKIVIRVGLGVGGCAEARRPPRCRHHGEPSVKVVGGKQTAPPAVWCLIWV